jgi:long-chain alkane monooxygenase
VIGLYHDFRGAPDFHAELGLQIPSNDAMVIISALAAATENLGLAADGPPRLARTYRFPDRVNLYSFYDLLGHLTLVCYPR